MSIDTIGQGQSPAIATRLMTGLTATGTNQATAFPLAHHAAHEFISVPAGTGAVLPVPRLPSEVSVFNGGLNALAIYPPIGGTINGGSANAPVTLAAVAGITLWASSLSSWYTTSTGVAGGGGGSGTVTLVTAGTGLAGGNITTTGTIAIAASGVGTPQLASSAVTYAKLQNAGASVLLGNPTGGPAAPTEITLGTGLGFSAGSLVATGGTGTVTSILTGAGLTGGPITGSGTVAILAGGVGSTQLAPASVTYTKIQPVTAARLLGNPTGSLGSPSEITLGTGLSFAGSTLNVAAGGTGTVTSITSGTGLTGGTITTSGTVAIASGGVGTTQLAASGVTYANIQNVAASSLLGNPTGSPAAPVEITLAANSGLIFSAGTITTSSVSVSSLFDSALGSVQGDVLYRGASTWNVLAPGASGQLLSSGGAAANPSWITASGTGTVTSVSVVTANGFSGTVASATTAPAITLSLAPTGLHIDSHYGVITADTYASTTTLNLATSDWHQITLTGNVTIALASPTVGQMFTVVLIQGGSGSNTATWFTTIKWAGGTPPTLTTSVGGIDVLSFKCVSSGQYYGFVLGQAFA